jgi:hypothetical protein
MHLGLPLEEPRIAEPSFLTSLRRRSPIRRCTFSLLLKCVPLGFQRRHQKRQHVRGELTAWCGTSRSILDGLRCAVRRDILNSTIGAGPNRTEQIVSDPGRCPPPLHVPHFPAFPAWLALATHLWRSNHYGRYRSMWKNPRPVEMLKSLPVGKTAKSPIKPDNGRAEENSFSF